MTKAIHDLLSPDAVMLAINSMAKERQEVSSRLDAGTVDDEEWEYQSDLVLRLTASLNEFGNIYESMREGDSALPSFAKIIEAYE